jgi:uncharacterized protein (TIGR02594 family)
MTNARNEGCADFESDDLPDLDIILRQPRDVESFGLQAARKEEIEKADAILAATPSDKSPLEVMQYFAALNVTNADGEFYNAGWKVRWNPVIVRFFAATNFGKPAGDTTFWCAASLNWCLKKSGFQHGTNSAASQSFRGAPGKTGSPKPGDIVVFRKNDDPDHGHVTLYLGQNEDHVQVIGGNQTDKRGHHAICAKWIPKSNGLILHSYHSIEAFR